MSKLVRSTWVCEAKLKSTSHFKVASSLKFTIARQELQTYQILTALSNFNSFLHKHGGIYSSNLNCLKRDF